MKKVLNNSERQQIYIFDLDKKLLSCGELSKFTTDVNDPLQLVLNPFFADDDANPWQLSYDDVAAGLFNEDYRQEHEVLELVDLSHKLIIISSQVLSD